MQSLYPTDPSTLTDDDLAGLYAYPVERTWVRTNFVSTLDGAVQGPDGRSGSIAPPADQRLFELLRTLCDVVLVGAGTARTEGYQPVRSHEVDATQRRRLGLTAVPAIAVVSRSLGIVDELLDGGEAPTLVVTSRAAPAGERKRLSERCQVVVAGDDEVDARTAVDLLSGQGFHRILCEGGPRLMHDLVASGRCDDLCLTIAPHVVGGDGYRMTRGPLVQPPAAMLLRHVLEDEGSLFCRYTKVRG
ncbi:MAG: pyrimidine reductase family protein [Propionibacteriales bacterium]|nr:pyrimidine reductase family protein [Propionibacteriales bacterium]